MLRELKRLPSAEPASAASAAAARPSVEISVSRVLFVLAVIATAITAIYTLLNYLAIPHIRVGRSPEQMIAEDQSNVDALKPDQLMREWNQLAKDGLGMRDPTPEMFSHLMQEALKEQVANGLVACGLLFVVCLVLCVIANRSRRKSQKK